MSERVETLLRESKEQAEKRLETERAKLEAEIAEALAPKVEIYTDADGKHTSVYVPEGVTVLRKPLEVDEAISALVGR